MAKIKEYLFATGLPAQISQKTSTFIFSGLLITIISLVMLIICLIRGNGVSLLGFPIITGLALLVYGCVNKILVVKKGFYVLQGVCIRHCYPTGGSLNGRLGPTGFGVRLEKAAQSQSEDGRITLNEESNVDFKIYVPISKRREFPLINQAVSVYLPADAEGYESGDGLMKYNQVFGYSID